MNDRRPVTRVVLHLPGKMWGCWQPQDRSDVSRHHVLHGLLYFWSVMSESRQVLWKPVVCGALPFTICSPTKHWTSVHICTSTCMCTHAHTPLGTLLCISPFLHSQTSGGKHISVSLPSPKDPGAVLPIPQKLLSGQNSHLRTCTKWVLAPAFLLLWHYSALLFSLTSFASNFSLNLP